MPSRLQTRASAITLFGQGMRNASLAARLTGAKKRTMQHLFKKLRAGESLEDKPRSGGPRKLTSALRRSLAQIKAKHPYKSARWYARKLSEVRAQPVGVSTVKTALRQLDYRYRLVPRRTLTRAQMTARVAFASAHLTEDWAKRWSFDESYFNLYRNGNRYWVRTKTDDAVSQPSKPKLSEAQEKVSVGIAVAICRGRKSALAFLPKGWSAADLVDVFARTLLPSLRWSNRRGYENELMIDHDGRHHSAVWRHYVEQQRLRPFPDWPSNSPDLNPVENVFAWMKRFVEDRDPRNEQQLKEAIQAAWDELPVEMTETLMDSLPHRLELVIARHGGRSGY